MSFNHYAKISRILSEYPTESWYVKRVNQPTSAKNFKGEMRYFDHYYRVFTNDGQPIKYCKFQQLDRFYQAIKIPPEEITIKD